MMRCGREVTSEVLLTVTPGQDDRIRWKLSQNTYAAIHAPGEFMYWGHIPQTLWTVLR